MTTMAIDEHLAPTYRRPALVFERGEGVWLYDSEGRKYLDGLAGIAVNALGYADPEIVAVMREAAGGLIHVSNLYHTAPHLQLARELCEASFADRVFFTNSGTEAVEGALKMARLATGKTELVAFDGSFHGRTMGALSVTSTEKYRKPFEPLVPGVRWAAFNDLGSAADAIGPQTAAVIVEPVQGEGGIRLATSAFLQCLRKLCDERGAALIFDEVQCGLGRTGTLWAHDSYSVSPGSCDVSPEAYSVSAELPYSVSSPPYGVSPDLMALAKPLGAGLPIGAILMRQHVADALHPGDHGSTFAGGPFVTSVARTVLRRISQPAFLQHVRDVGARLEENLRALQYAGVVEVRGRGLMWGVQLAESIPVAEVVDACLARGLVVGGSGGNTVRIVPPLIIDRPQVDALVAILGDVIGGFPQ